MSDPVDTPDHGSDGIPQHAAPEKPGSGVGGNGDRPEPVLDAARVAGVISGVILGLGGALKLVGVLVPRDYDLQALADQTANAVLAVAAAWSLFGPWLLARVRARDKVTPLSSPRDAAGRRLIATEEP
jgi:hypothetical protein